MPSSSSAASGCAVEVSLVDGGPAFSIVGSGFPADEPAILTLDDGGTPLVLTQAEAPALHSDVRGAVLFRIAAERENVGTNAVKLSAGGCSATGSVPITAGMFPPECSSTEPVATGGQEVEAYKAIVLGDHPIAYWRFEEESGPLARQAATGDPGAYQGDPALGQAGAIDGSRAVALDGDGDWIDIPDLALSDDFTIEGWVLFCENDISADDVLVGNAEGGANLNFHEGRYRLWTGAADVAEITDQMELERWYHLAAVRSGSSIVLYVDGVEAARGSHTDPLPVGALGFGGGESTLGGLLDEIAIYDHALSAKQLAAHAAAAS